MEELAAILKYAIKDLQLIPKVSLMQCALTTFEIGQTIPISKMDVKTDDVKQSRSVADHDAHGNIIGYHGLSGKPEENKGYTAWRPWFIVRLTNGVIYVTNEIESNLKYRKNGMEVHQFSYLLAEPDSISKMAEDIKNEIDYVQRLFDEGVIPPRVTISTAKKPEQVKRPMNRYPKQLLFPRYALRVWKR